MEYLRKSRKYGNFVVNQRFGTTNSALPYSICTGVSEDRMPTPVVERRGWKMMKIEINTFVRWINSCHALYICWPSESCAGRREDRVP